MSFLKNFDWSFKSIIKALGLLLLVVLGFLILFALINFSYKFVSRSLDFNDRSSEPSAYTMSSGGEADYGYISEEGTPFLNAATDSIMPPMEPGYSTGNAAEDFEVKTYTGSIKTKALDDVCSTIESLKEKDYVIFENSNHDDFYCHYRFKVENEQAESVLKMIEDLKPENLNTNITSIKKSIEGLESELEILTKKLQSIEETLANAQASYDEISQLATEQQDVATLATIIDSKLNLIEKLTTEKLNVKSQIDYYNQNKVDQLDQLDFTFFNISVEKDVILDGKQIKENWKYEAKQMVEGLSSALQFLTLKLITYLVYFAIAVLYLFISVFFLKWIWRGVKKICMSGRPNHKGK